MAMAMPPRLVIRTHCFPAKRSILSSALLYLSLTVASWVCCSSSGVSDKAGSVQVCVGREVDFTHVCPGISRAPSGSVLRDGYVILAWTGNSTDIIADARIHFRSGYDVTLSHVTRDDDVTYQCSWSDADNSSMTLSHEFGLEVLDNCSGISVSSGHQVILISGASVAFKLDTNILGLTALYMTSPHDVMINNGKVAETYVKRLTLDSNTSHVSLSRITTGESGTYTLHQGDTRITWTVVVVGWTERLSDMKVKPGENVTLSWRVEDTYLHVVNVKLWKLGTGGDLLLNTNSSDSQLSSAASRKQENFYYLNDVTILLTDVTKAHAGTYRISVTLRSNVTAEDLFVLHDDVTMTVVTSRRRSMWVDFPLLTGLCALGLVMLIPVGICVHICCGRAKTHLTPVNMHHGAYHGAAGGEGSCPSLAPGEIDPRVLHTRILELRRDRGRTRTASETTVESANEMWGFCESPPASGYPRGHKGRRNYARVKTWDSNGNASV